MSDKIDFVLIWVDGNDPKWRAEKNIYDGKSGDDRDVRFRDWENLKYWFRGVEKYAPWVNNVYFVTWGHIPKWLNVNCEKLHIINHKDYIPKEYLPTFSSHVIELNLHRIKGLQEQFVYFNDDMFLIDNVKASDFFKNNKPCDSAILSPAIKKNKFGIGNVELNNMAIVNSYFQKNKQIKAKVSKWYNTKYELKHLIKNICLSPWNSFTAFYEFHVASSFLKSTFDEIWDKEFDELDEVCKHRFRDIRLDVNQWLMRDWQLASNNFLPRSTKFARLFTLDAESNIEYVLNNKAKMVCLNDSEDLTDEEYEGLKAAVIREFEKKLPEKSIYEI